MNDFLSSVLHKPIYVSNALMDIFADSDYHCGRTITGLFLFCMLNGIKVDKGFNIQNRSIVDCIQSTDG